VCYRTSGVDHWIGLYKLAPASTDNCHWLDGNPSTYRKWAATEPNSADLCIRMTNSGRYRDISCSSMYGYVCKGDIGIYSGLGAVAEPGFKGWEA